MNEVAELLDKNDVYYRPSGRDFLTTCFNPEHSDKNPSFRIDQVSGIGHCFSCGFKFNIFRYYGVITNTNNIKIAGLKKKLKDIVISMNGLEFPEGYTPITSPFRGISAKTLRIFGAFYTDQEEKLQDRIVFPIYDITNKIVVFTGRHTLSDGNPRYVNFPSGVTMPMYPCKLQDTDTKSIILVEGIFDMLNLYDSGIRNAICCFGTNTVNANSITEKLLPFKAQGITKVYILFDGDKAGREAAKNLKPIIEEQSLEVEIINLPDDIDPGNMSQEDIQSIKEYTK